jgi:RimJ/RimL family protein N-acetyltransferase
MTGPDTVRCVPGALELLTTDRLELTRLVPADHDFLARLWNNPAVAATLGGLRPPAEIATRVARLERLWSNLGYGVWIMRTPTGPIGYCGLAPTDVGGPGGVELLYAQLPEEWGNGYVTEAARLIVDVALDPLDGLGLDEVVAFTLATNTASRTVMERCGFTFAGAVEHAGLPHVLYRRFPGNP